MAAVLSDVPLDLPVRPALPPLLRRADRQPAARSWWRRPGTGKTTLVPLAVADGVAGRVVVAQPRRVAARAAARRMADLLGERVGDRVGYAVRGERRVGPATRVEVVTTGLLVRRLQRDPELPGVDAVLLDECHERHLDADLALAFTVDVRAALRPDLWLVAMSATPDADRFAALLGGDAAGPGDPRPSGPAPGRPGLDAATAPGRAAGRRAGSIRPCSTTSPPPSGGRCTSSDGDVLVFLPGAGEIAAVAGRLADLPTAVAVLPLHGRLPAARRTRAAPRPDARRVVLATAVAESSLTVPGRAGGGRRRAGPGAPHRPGPRAGRAGHRAGVPGRRHPAGRPGRPGGAGRGLPLLVGGRPTTGCAAQPEPEIATADLTGFALELAAWGGPDGVGLALPDPPPAAAMTVARETLTTLGAVDADGRITAAGTGDRRRRARTPGWPGRCSTAPAGSARDRAAEVVALLAEDGAGRAAATT